MNISDIADDYLIDRKEGMKKLTAGFLNEVMQLEAENQIQALTVQDVEHRLANALLKMADDKNFINLLISKKDLASHIGTSRETLSRKLTSFERKGWIKQEGQRKIKITNRDALVKMLEV